ncbi:hypothetical protein KJ781_00725 [Patescibacteria group bacterium]|nr:hypothetical protein [Patescibacteria group bacterium]MBU1448578.1 hypothetical protein [Patescibacteria group bacterium]MBU2613021.1 hypothetical protein [Patescibacteria group bacterium]
MTPSHSLTAVLIFGIIGTLFSGYLSISELIGADCSSCSVLPAATSALGAPACVYGFVLFVTITLIAALGLRKTT